MYAGEGNNSARASTSFTEDVVRGGETFSQSLAWKAWSRLLDAEIVERVDSGVRPTVDMDAVRRALDRHEGVTAVMKAWGSSWIT